MCCSGGKRAEKIGQDIPPVPSPIFIMCYTSPFPHTSPLPLPFLPKWVCASWGCAISHPLHWLTWSGGMYETWRHPSGSTAKDVDLRKYYFTFKESCTWCATKKAYFWEVWGQYQMKYQWYSLIYSKAVKELHIYGQIFFQYFSIDLWALNGRMHVLNWRNWRRSICWDNSPMLLNKGESRLGLVDASHLYLTLATFPLTGWFGKTPFWGFCFGFIH